MSRPRKFNIKTTTSVQTSLEFRASALEMLCRDSLLFHGEKTFNSIYRFKGKLTYFMGLMHDDLKKAQSYYNKSLADELQTAKTTLIKEVKTLLHS